jgi:ribosomal protein S17E
MPNVTISVSDDLKAKMDKLTEVNWSKICREAIAKYITEREYPQPFIELDLRNVHLDNSHPSGYPTLTATLRIHNKMNINILVRKVLFRVRFRGSKNQPFVGLSYDLNENVIESSSIGQRELFLPIFREKLREIAGDFDSTFTCDFECNVMCEGFTRPYNATLSSEIAIDKWQEFTKEALLPMQK